MSQGLLTGYKTDRGTSDCILRAQEALSFHMVKQTIEMNCVFFKMINIEIRQLIQQGKLKVALSG